MLKTNEMYKKWCNELGIKASRVANIDRFMKADDVYYSEEDGEIFIDKNYEMVEWCDGYYYHESYEISDTYTDDDLVDIPLYRKLVNEQ